MHVQSETHPPCRHCQFDNNEIILSHCKCCGASLAPTFISQLASDTELVVREIYLKSHFHLVVLAVAFFSFTLGFYYISIARRDCASTSTVKEVSLSPQKNYDARTV
jgi:hypothetical protein